MQSQSETKLILKEKLETLSTETKSLLSYFGAWDENSSKRAARSITEKDEFLSIILSIHLMTIVLENKDAEDIKKALAKKLNEGQVEYKGYVAKEKAEDTDLSENLTHLIRIRDGLQSLWPNQKDKLIYLYILHHAGKIHEFLDAHDVAIYESRTAESTHFYLKCYLEKNTQDQKDYHAANLWIRAFDNLFNQPEKLLVKNSINMLEKTADSAITKLATLIKNESPSLEKLTEVMNYLIFLRSNEINIKVKDTQFLIDKNTKNTLWKNLSFDQQKIITLIILSSGFISLPERQDLPPLLACEQFKKYWYSTQYQDLVKELTGFIIKNVTSESPIFLYNITGALHHSTEKGGSHFANGGSVEELFEVFYPRFLKIVNQEEKQFPIEKNKKIPLNKWQLFQLIEVNLKTLPQYIEHKEVGTNIINFADSKIKKYLLDKTIKNVETVESKTESKVTKDKNFLQKISSGKSLYDCDAGGDPDDAMYLALLKYFGVIPLAITHCGPYPTIGSRICKIIMKACGYEDVPVYRGIGCNLEDSPLTFKKMAPLFPKTLFGSFTPQEGDKAWYPRQGLAYIETFGGSFYQSRIESKKAPKYIAEIAEEYSSDNRLLIVATGPLINIAAALKINPNIADKIIIFAMGGIDFSYNFIPTLPSTAAVLSKVITVCVTKEFIQDNKFFITAEEFALIKKHLKTVLGKALIGDIENWFKGDAFGKKDIYLFDLLAFYLAKHREAILAYDTKRLSFPGLDSDGELKSEFSGHSYLEKELKNKLITAEDDKNGLTHFITKVQSPEKIRDILLQALSKVITEKSYDELKELEKTNQLKL